MATKKGEKDGEGTSKLYGDWQTEPWVPKAAVGGKVSMVGGARCSLLFDCALAVANTRSFVDDKI